MIYGILLTIPIGMALIVLYYFKRSFSYWKRHNLPTIEPRFPFGIDSFGNMENPLWPKQSIGSTIKACYDALRARGHQHGGLYFGPYPIYCPVDPEHVKNILQKDSDHFTDRGRYFNERDDPLSGNLFNIGGKKWRDLRRKLSQTFTSGKMKSVFHILVQCSQQLEEAIDRIYEEQDGIVNIKDTVSRYSIDTIGLFTMGLECNSFKEEHSEFQFHGDQIFSTPSKIDALLIFLGNAKLELGNFLRIRLFPKMPADFYIGLVDQTVKFRESNGLVRNDMLQLMMALKNNKDEKCNDGKSLTMEQIAAHAMLFLVAGYQTSSRTITFCLFELAQNPEIQTKVREEIVGILEKNKQRKVTYESLKEMKYLQQVIDETLRIYPISPFINRKCTKQYKIPNSDATIEQGIVSYISILGLQHDEEYFPDPEKFDPERFSVKNRHKIRPFTYLPFGEGPRLCLGLRFGMMQIQLGLIGLLKRYEFSVNYKTKLPLKMKTDTNLLFIADKILLNVHKVVQ